MAEKDASRQQAEEKNSASLDALNAKLDGMNEKMDIIPDAAAAGGTAGGLTGGIAGGAASGNK